MAYNPLYHVKNTRLSLSTRARSLSPSLATETHFYKTFKKRNRFRNLKLVKKLILQLDNNCTNARSPQYPYSSYRV